MNDAIGYFQELLNIQGRGNRHTRRANAALLKHHKTKARKFVVKYLIAWAEAIKCRQ